MNERLDIGCCLISRNPIYTYMREIAKPVMLGNKRNLGMILGILQIFYISNNIKATSAASAYQMAG